MRKLVGISQKIKRAWLDAVLDRLVQTTDEAELRAFLDKHLKSELPGKESRAKTAGIILRVWSGIPPERIGLRNRAVAMLPRISGQERIWLHWGMAALAYPFFRDTAEVLGRLLGLQDDFTSAQVQSRLLTTWGDRATSKEASQKLIHTLVDWEVLRATKTRGHFLLARKMTTGTAELQLWLLEALLGASAAEEIEAQQLLRLPETFPFTLGVGVADLRRCDAFNIHRQGLDMDMVALRKVKSEPPPKPAKKSKKKATAADGPNLFERETEEVAGVEAPQWTLADAPFDALVAECGKLTREGRFHACIALAQGIAESALLLLWRVKIRKRKNQTADIMKALDALLDVSLIKDERKAAFDRLWEDRHTILLPSHSEKRLLEERAKTGLNLAKDLVKDFFGYAQRDGVVIPDHPEYWHSAKDDSPVVAGRIGN